MSANLVRLHTLKPSHGSRKAKRIRGRGDSSGRGSYSGRGRKGQKARSGTHGLQYLGLRRMVLSTPKARGFRSLQDKPAIINVGLLSPVEEGTVINPKFLYEKGLVKNIEQGVKILGEGELTKKLIIEGCAVSQSAKEKIEKVGGKIQ